MFLQEFQGVFYQDIEELLILLGKQLFNQCGWIWVHQEELNELHTTNFLPP